MICRYLRLLLLLDHKPTKNFQLDRFRRRLRNDIHKVVSLLLLLLLLVVVVED